MILDVAADILILKYSRWCSDDKAIDDTMMILEYTGWYSDDSRCSNDIVMILDAIDDIVDVCGCSRWYSDGSRCSRLYNDAFRCFWW